jgi:CubicO group peptidase (beta-lactamase class C family)
LSADAAIGSVGQLYDGALTSDLQIRTFQHGERLFPVRKVARGARVIPLLRASGALTHVLFRSRGKAYDLVDYLALNRVTGLLVLKSGRIALEEYQLGNDESTRWMSMSIVKSITAALIGAAIRQGLIATIDDAVTEYLPQLAGSAYDDVSVRHLLQMSSGVRWTETYTNPDSDRRRMLAAQVAQRPGAILDLLAALPRAAAPGSLWNYSTGETYLAGALLRAAIGRPLAEYLSERIWRPCGMESEASWWLDAPGGLEIGGSGLSATLRDYGRFGQFMLNGGIAGGERILPEHWMQEASTPKLVDGKSVPYGYMLWPVTANVTGLNAGAYRAIGIFGQHIYVNPQAEVVIVVWGALPKPSDSAPILDEDFFAAVVAALHAPAT